MEILKVKQQVMCENVLWECYFITICLLSFRKLDIIWNLQSNSLLCGWLAKNQITSTEKKIMLNLPKLCVCVFVWGSHKPSWKGEYKHHQRRGKSRVVWKSSVVSWADLECSKLGFGLWLFQCFINLCVNFFYEKNTCLY